MKVNPIRLVLLLLVGAGHAVAAETSAEPAKHIVAIENVCAWPNLTLMPDGTIIAIIHNKPSHGGMEGEIECWASKDGKKWRKRGNPAPHEPNTVRMNHAAGLAKNGDLIVLCSGWTNLKQPQRPKQKPFRDDILQPWVCRSSDGGRTWSQIKKFPARETGWSEHIPFGDIFVAEDGSLRTSTYQGKFKDETKGTKIGSWRAWQIRSDDDGKTWRTVNIIGPRHNETSLFHAGGKRWMAAARIDAVESFASEDDGATWSDPQRVTERNEINAHLTRLQDGRLLLTYGNRVKDQFGVLAKFSSDEGKTWGVPIRLSRSKSSDCGYPSSVQRKDGKVVTAYYSKQSELCDHYHMGVVIWDPVTDQHADKVFLLPYFLGNGETGVYFAYSRDGLKFQWLNDGEVVMPAPQWKNANLTRDPSIVYHDGIFHMVWTTSWNSRSIGYSHSTDLVDWSAPTKIDIWSEFTAVKNTWAPELHWDPEQREFLILWSSTTLAELEDADGSADSHGYDHRSYAARTKDFQTFSKPELFFSPMNPEYGVIDPFIAHDDRGTPDRSDDRWVMVIKNEMQPEQGGKNLRLTFSKSMQGPYATTLSPPIVGAGTDIVNTMGEGPSLSKNGGQWFLYWDAPGSEFSYCLATSPDLKTWTNRSSEMSLPAKQMRHGTVLAVPQAAVRAALDGRNLSLPTDAPYPPSRMISGIAWAPRESIARSAKGSDNFPLTWADDDHIYTTWGDGNGFSDLPRRSMGFARIEGLPPKHRGIDIRSEQETFGSGRKGKKGWGLLCVDRVLYLWMGHADKKGGQAQLAWSRDHARTWEFADWEFTDFGLIGFVNFGQNYSDARDDYVYAYSHDGPKADTPADRFILMRVPKDTILDRSAYEFLAGFDTNQRPRWSRDVAKRSAVFEHRDSCLRSAMTWNPGLGRYLWWQHIPQSAGAKDRGDTRFAGGFGIYDAPEPWGPWTTAFFTKKWDVGPGEHGDFPAKWISKDGKSAQLVFSGDDCFSVRRAGFELAITKEQP